ncbi:MAG: Fimbrial assembly family protein, partial [Bacteroidetes bacterium]|nr:Fimbrial assembly family protein [Bacteroidota bacterium]
MPRIKLVHSADLALLEIVRSSYELQEESVTVLAYVGYDFSRVIFMQGNNYLHFAPLISEGYHAANIENTIYSRIRLELENNGLRRIDRILLAGESHKGKLLDAMGPEFPQTKIEYLGVPGIEKPPSSSPVDNVISEYAIPLAVAWRA